MKMQDIQELSEKERGEKLSDLREEYFNLKFQMATGKIENPGRLKFMRQDIARILTLQNNTPEPEAAKDKDNTQTDDKK